MNPLKAANLVKVAVRMMRTRLWWKS